jgi:hypothetical protein
MSSRHHYDAYQNPYQSRAAFLLEDRRPISAPPSSDRTLNMLNMGATSVRKARVTTQSVPVSQHLDCMAKVGLSISTYSEVGQSRGRKGGPVSGLAPELSPLLQAREQVGYDQRSGRLRASWPLKPRYTCPNRCEAVDSMSSSLIEAGSRKSRPAVWSTSHRRYLWVSLTTSTEGQRLVNIQP